jgi:quinoprotein glucose dehydrogenase
MPGLRKFARRLTAFLSGRCGLDLILDSCQQDDRHPLRDCSCTLLVSVTLTFFSCAIASQPQGHGPVADEWPVYGGNWAAQHYSSLAQINRANVRLLREAWRFNSDEPGDPETNPLVIGRTLFAFTPALKVVALDATNGSKLWQFDSGLNVSSPSRGLAYGSHAGGATIFAGIANFLFALDATTGKPVSSFGEGGHIDLRKGLRGDYTDHYVSLTSPAVLYRDLLIVGFRTSETHPAPPGDIRAFDARTGALRWTFHTIPRGNERGSQTWPNNAWKTAGAANNWAGMSLDEKRGIVFVPTGSAVDDFYGADRPGDNLFADTLLALNARTGRRIWHFQAVHHDLLDRDLPAAPVLLTVTHDGRREDVVAQPTKQGFLYVLNRETGKPIYPIREIPVAGSDVPGERSSPTQPEATVPEPFSRQSLTADSLTNRTPEARRWALEQSRSYRAAAIDRPTVVFPGYDGGAEWGGAAVDPGRGILYVNANDVAWTAQLAPNDLSGGPGATLYQQRCSGCHGPGGGGSPPAFPSLMHVESRLSRAQIEEVVHGGRGRMPQFPSITGPALDELLAYLRGGIETSTKVPDTVSASSSASDTIAKQEMTVPLDREPTAAYRFTGYKKFLDPDGYPAVAPPWGTLSAINLNTGQYLWKVPLGEYPALVAQGYGRTGSENYGGPVVTAGGLLFIGATLYDKKLRAFDPDTGKILWEAALPYAGTATPATYRVDGKQYVVIATNNERDKNSPQGFAYVAFALP